MPDGADTTRDAVAAAFKEVSARAEPAPAPDPAPEPSPAPSTPAEPSGDAEARAEAKAAEDRARDGKGRFIVPKKPAAPEKAPASTTSAGQGGAVAPLASVLAAAPPASPALEALKPPQDWRAQAKEKWAGLPREVQEEALRLHVETKRTLQEMAELRKGHEPYAKATAPYEAMIRAEGMEPHAAIGLLLQREAALRTAPMQTRAAIIAHGIRTFLGTDEQAINLLAQALDSSPAQQRPQVPQQFDPNQIIAQAEQRLMQRLEESRNQSLTTSAQSEVESFANSHEFVNEPDPETGLTLGEDMANLMEAAIGRGKDLSFDDAYKLAIKRHSVASKVIGQREAAKAATAKAATTQAARAASSSLRNEPAGPSNGKTKDIRETVAEAYYAQKNAH